MKNVDMFLQAFVSCVYPNIRTSRQNIIQHKKEEQRNHQ